MCVDSRKAGDLELCKMLCSTLAGRSGPCTLCKKPFQLVGLGVREEQASSKFDSNKILLYSYYWLFTDYFHWQIGGNGLMELFMGVLSFLGSEVKSRLDSGPHWMKPSLTSVMAHVQKSPHSTEDHSHPLYWWYHDDWTWWAGITRALNGQKLSKKPGELQGPRLQGGS